ncbi:MAG TPA: PhzF family phenazine biosynthesis protein [Actinospica sp.]|nr:PhzF family phenazine biosynthesis protein [Actinospica sp.]
MTMNVLVVRVFADEDGRFGNELGVVLDAAGLDSGLGPKLTAHLGFSETVFVDRIDETGADVRIFNPTAEMRLAGHPLVGTSRVIAEATGAQPAVLRPRLADAVDTWREGEVTWIRGNAAFAPEFEFVRHTTPACVEGLAVPAVEERAHAQHWAWIDEAAGVLRARTFVGTMGIPEDEATGAAAIHQAQRLGRPVTIRQGRGSVLRARPAETPGWSEVGGLVVAEPARVIEL